MFTVTWILGTEPRPSETIVSALISELCFCPLNDFIVSEKNEEKFERLHWGLFINSLAGLHDDLSLIHGFHVQQEEELLSEVVL